jgi:hypothetical protein
MKHTASRRHRRPEIGRVQTLFSAPCWRGESSPEAFFITMPACYLSLWRDTSSELWTPVHSFTFILPSTASTVYFLQSLFTLPQSNIYFHTIRLILCFQQTGEIDNLTVSWGKVFWLCCVQIPRCYWHQSNYAPDSFWRRCQSQLTTTFGSDVFLLLVD